MPDRLPVTGVVLLAAMLWPAGALAEVTGADIVDPGPRNPAVGEAISTRRLQTDIVFLRPETEFAPDNRTVVILPPEDEPSAEDRSRANRITYGVVFGLLLAGIVAVLVTQGGRISVSFGAGPARGSRQQDPQQLPENRTAPSGPADGFLARLEGMADRRAALILLTGHALEKAAAANDLQLGRAQTARDVVRILPRSWRHLDALRRLVREAEFVHFGGRDLPDEVWQECLDVARPILAARAA